MSSYQNPFEPPTRREHPLERRPAPTTGPDARSPIPRDAIPEPLYRPRVSFPGEQPIVSYVLLGINVFVFLVDAFLSLAQGGLGGLGPLTLLGMKENQAILDGQYWRFITPLFLHGGIIHLGFNSYFLYMIGPQVERPFGRLRFLSIYLLAGLGASLASFMLTSNPSVGASGALFGVIGALIPYLYRNRGILANSRPQIMSIIQVIGINLLIGLTPGIDNWAHVGGLITGLGLAWLIAPLYKVKVANLEQVVIEDQTEPLVVWVLTGVVAAWLIIMTFTFISFRSF